MLRASHNKVLQPKPCKASGYSNDPQGHARGEKRILRTYDYTTLATLMGQGKYIN